jgi:hypothetical protein
MSPTILEAILKNKGLVGSDEQVEKLKTEILDLARTSSPASFTNPGCWRGIQNLSNINFLLKEISLLVNEAIEYYSSKDQQFSSISSKDFTIHYWSNVNAPGSRNVLHAHKPGVFSGVYYLQGTGTGALRIINPANILGECNPESPFTRDFFFEPKDRDLIIWPSWLPHEVEPNLSNKDRINIAFDVRFTNED